MRNWSDSEGRPDKEESKQFEGCLKKNFYDDWWSATHQAAVRRLESGHDNIYAYKCHFCPGFHLGHRRVNGNKIVRKKPKG